VIFLRLLRLPNLILLVVTLYVITIRVIYPPLIVNKIAPALTSKEYLLFLFIALCLGAGGYVYNDIVDQKTDLENQKRLIVGHKITHRIALGAYFFLTIAPLLPMLSLTMELDRPDYLWYYFGVVVTLWLYNQYLKKLPLIGNVVVAGLCGLAVLMPYLLELDAMLVLKENDVGGYWTAIATIIAFTTFSFLANLIREVIKDIEDIEGDKAAGHHTLPILAGIAKSNIVAQVLSMVLLAAIITWSIYAFIQVDLKSIISCGLLIIPLILLIIKMKSASMAQQFHDLSQYWKMYFAVGIVSLIIMTY